MKEQDKSSDIERQPPFGDCKYSNTLPQNSGGVGGGSLQQPTRTSYNLDKVWSGEAEFIIKLERGCPYGTKYPPRQPIQTLQAFYPNIIREYPGLTGNLCVKFDECRCKGKAVMHQKPFSIINALWPWPLTPKSIGHILDSWAVFAWSFMMIGVKAVTRHKQFSIINALWPWPLTFWPRNP